LPDLLEEDETKRQVPRELGEKIAKKLGIAFYEVGKTGRRKYELVLLRCIKRKSSR